MAQFAIRLHVYRRSRKARDSAHCTALLVSSGTYLSIRASRPELVVLATPCGRRGSWRFDRPSADHGAPDSETGALSSATPDPTTATTPLFLGDTLPPPSSTRFHQNAFQSAWRSNNASHHPKLTTPREDANGRGVLGPVKAVSCHAYTP